MPMPTLTCVRWYEHVGPGVTATGRWLRSAEGFPEVAPVRFGSTEPLTHRFEVEGEDGLRAAERIAGGVLFMKLQSSRSHVSLATPGSSTAGGDHGAHTLITEIPPGEPRLREFALAFASERTFFISISLRRRPDLGDSGVREPYLAPLGHWLGLPPEPPIWSWFGPEYAHALSRKHVPLERDERGAVLAGPNWVPEEFRARTGESESRRRIAPRIPAGL